MSKTPPTPEGDDWISTKQQPIPLNEVVQLVMKNGYVYEHAAKYIDMGLTASGYGIMEREVAYWRLKPPADFKFPGDAPGSYTADKESE